MSFIESLKQKRTPQAPSLNMEQGLAQRYAPPSFNNRLPSNPAGREEAKREEMNQLLRYLNTPPSYNNSLR